MRSPRACSSAPAAAATPSCAAYAIPSAPPCSTPAAACSSTAASAATPRFSRFPPAIWCKCSSSSAARNRAPLLERLSILNSSISQFLKSGHFPFGLTRVSRELGLQDSLSLRPRWTFMSEQILLGPQKQTGRKCRLFEPQACEVPPACRPAAAFNSKEAVWSATIRDVSAGGVRLVLRRRFETGTGLAIELPGNDDTYTVLAQ